MKLTLGGVRGSCPVAQPAFMHYGGETTSFLLEGTGGERIMVDAGTGARLAADRMMADPGDRTLWLFMTHYHLDHVMGLTMLPMMYSPEWTVHIAAPEGRIGPEDALRRLFDPSLWPLQVDDLRAKLVFHTLPGRASVRPWNCCGIEVRWTPVSHPGGCTAYRFDEPATGASVAIATDVEWGAASHEERVGVERLLQHPRPVGLLVMDGQYDDVTITLHRGWGHSSWAEVIELASRCRVRRVMITHHDAAADDDRLAKVDAQIRAACPSASLARGGMVIALDAAQAAMQQQ